MALVSEFLLQDRRQSKSQLEALVHIAWQQKQQGRPHTHLSKAEDQNQVVADQHMQMCDMYYIRTYIRRKEKSR